jgi:hypothetical protein
VIQKKALLIQSREQGVDPEFNKKGSTRSIRCAEKRKPKEPRIIKKGCSHRKNGR